MGSIFYSSLIVYLHSLIIDIFVLNCCSVGTLDNFLALNSEINGILDPLVVCKFT